MTPIYILSGQSNAVALNNVDSFRQRILANDPDAVVVEYAVGGTAIYAKPTAVDWYAGNDGLTTTGELFAVLVSQIRTALEKHPDAYIAGMGWIQGENDALEKHGVDYAQNLGLLQDRLTEIFGEFPMAVLALSDNAPAEITPIWNPGWQDVQKGQIELAEERESVILLDPDDIAQEAGIKPTHMFGDYVHYTGPMLKAIGNEMADRLLAIDAANEVTKPTEVNVDKIELIYGTRNGTAGANKMTGLAGHEKMYGLAGNDTLDGSGGHDHLFGGDGNDVLIGNIGNDLLSGGIGNDNFVFNGSSGQDILEDFDLAADMLTFGDLSSAADFDRSSNSEGDLVLTWDHAGESQSLTILGLTQADFESIHSAFAM